jgi:predicted metal-dependent hydrolase
LIVARLELGGISVDVVFKDIKNVHLSVYPPTGRVRISAPTRMKLDTIRVFAISKLGWIKQQQKKLRAQERETPREYLNRESHYVWGKRYLLNLIESDAAPALELKHRKMVLLVRRGTREDKKQAIVDEWYRAQVKRVVPSLIAKWESFIGVKVKRFFVQKMKTKWGSCNTGSKCIRLNTELAKKPPECLEYIVVHEMVHLLVRRHDDHFTGLMDRCLPNWRFVRQILNAAPLAHTNWDY